MNMRESMDAGQDWAEKTRLKLNMPVDAFAAVRELYGQVTDQLKSVGTDLSGTPGEGILLHKLAIFCRANHSDDPLVIAQAVAAFPSVIESKGKPDLNEIVTQFRTGAKQAGDKTWREISERSGQVPMIAEFSIEGGQYYLGRLFTRGHFVANSDVLEHCLGRKSLDRYFEKSKRKDLEVYAVMRESDQTPVATIVYDTRLKSIGQIKQLGDKMITGQEEYFDAVIKSLAHLVQDTSYTESGLPYRRDVESVRDLEQISRDMPEVFVRSGSLVSVKDALKLDPKDVLGGSALPVDENIDVELLLKISEGLPLAIDMTNATNEQRSALRAVKGTFVDNREVIDGYDNLRIITGQVLVNKAREVALPALTETNRGIYADQTESLMLPALKKITGRIDAPAARVVNADLLTEVAGNIDLSGVESLQFPNLQKVGWDIRAMNATQIDCQKLVHLGGTLYADKAMDIKLPALQSAVGIQCSDDAKLTKGSPTIPVISALQ